MQVPIELKKRYLDRRIGELSELIKCLEDEDFGPALKLGHQVKGSAVTFDFPEIALYGDQIEAAANVKDKESLHQLISELSGLIQQFRTQFH